MGFWDGLNGFEWFLFIVLIGGVGSLDAFLSCFLGIKAADQWKPANARFAYVQKSCVDFFRFRNSRRQKDIAFDARNVGKSRHTFSL